MFEYGEGTKIYGPEEPIFGLWVWEGGKKIYRLEGPIFGPKQTFLALRGIMFGKFQKSTRVEGK